MVQRCTNPKRRYYHRYGGRGVKLHEPWLDFENFLADMGERPDGMTIEREDNDGDYVPKNCRWATKQEQIRNRCNIVWVSVGTESLPLKVAAAKLGLNPKTLRKQLKAEGKT